MNSHTKSPFILVMDSITIELMLPCSHLPTASESILGQPFKQKQGGKGANGAQQCTALKVDAVDATRAGETLYETLGTTGVLTKHLPEAMDFAQHAAAFSVIRRGAQVSMPRLSKLKQRSVTEEVTV